MVEQTVWLPIWFNIIIKCSPEHFFAKQVTAKGRQEYLRFAQKLNEKIAHEEFDAAAAHIEKNFFDIDNVEETWQFIEGPFLGAVFPSASGSSTNSLARTHIDGLNIVVGAIQLKQLRLKSSKSIDECAGTEKTKGLGCDFVGMLC